MIDVVIADDQELVRSGLRMMLEAEQDITVVGEASTGAGAFAQVQQLDPDVIVMDIRMPELDGIEATRRLSVSGARARVLVLTTFDLDNYVYEAMKAGASGFLLKDATREQLAAGVRTVAAGDALLAPAITRRLVQDFCRRPAPNASLPAAVANLTERELQVFRLLARGLSNSEIAVSIYLGETTVKSHVARVLTKLGLRDRAQAIVFAYESGAVTPGET